MLHILEKERVCEFMKLGVQQRIGLQGYPSKDVVVEACEALRKDAAAAIFALGREYLPWMKWPSPEEIQAMQKGSLVEESKELIEAWIRHFEPENVEAAGVA